MVAESPLSDEEQELLEFVIDTHIEGLEDAKAETTNDRTLETPEELVNVCAGYGETKEVLERIKIKLRGGKQ